MSDITQKVSSDGVCGPIVFLRTQSHHWAIPLHSICWVHKNNVHGMLKCCAYVYNPKWHSSVRKHTPLGTESSFESVKFYYQNLTVSWEIIKKRKHLYPRYYLKNVVHRRNGVDVFVWGMVYIPEIDTQEDFPGILMYMNNIWNSCGRMNFVYDMCIQQLSKLFLYERFKWRMYFPQLMLIWIDPFFNRDDALDDPCVISFQIIIRPHEHISVLFEKIDKGLPLLLCETCTKIDELRIFFCS